MSSWTVNELLGLNAHVFAQLLRKKNQSIFTKNFYVFHYQSAVLVRKISTYFSTKQLLHTLKLSRTARMCAFHFTFAPFLISPFTKIFSVFQYQAALAKSENGWYNSYIQKYLLKGIPFWQWYFPIWLPFWLLFLGTKPTLRATAKKVTDTLSCQ